MLPDVPLSLSVLRTLPVSVDVAATVGTLRVRGHDWRSVSVTALAAGGRLAVEPASAESPGGPLAGALSADATGPRPTLALALRSSGAGVDLAPLLEALGASAPLRGRARLDFSLRGGGNDLRTYLGSLEGHAALSMGAGTLDPALVGRLTAPLRGVVPEGALGGAATLRCLDLRFAAADGTARAETALLRTGLGGATATGSVNLRDETLALRLNPVVRVGSVSVTTPVTVGGTFAAPTVSVDRGGAAAAAAGALGAIARGSRDEETAALGALAEALSGGTDTAVPGCDGTPAPAAPRPQRAPGVGDVLRGLLGR
ncbi:AsmA-like C-terminal region-containing protein [Roseomonas sp. CCTCC AB2023176]|uniref:AsmA family protein n=1 Tax=Roseomonas sp. CCTCC AB2023176 TaxID=3342640 RepID=UPI0035E18832